MLFGPCALLVDPYPSMRLIITLAQNIFLFWFVGFICLIFIGTEWQLGHMLCELRHVMSYALCIYCALKCLAVHFCSWLCISVPDCAFLCLTVHWLCTQSPIPRKERSWEIFRNQGKCLVIPGTSDCALYFCYYVCAEFLAEAVKGTVLWYFIYGPFYFCSLDSREFWFMKCI